MRDGVAILRDADVALLVDRRADVPEDLYVTYLGSDFVEEGRNAARTIGDLLKELGTESRTLFRQEVDRVVHAVAQSDAW